MQIYSNNADCFHELPDKHNINVYQSSQSADNYQLNFLCNLRFRLFSSKCSSLALSSSSFFYLVLLSILPVSTDCKYTLPDTEIALTTTRPANSLNACIHSPVD